MPYVQNFLSLQVDEESIVILAPGEKHIYFDVERNELRLPKNAPLVNSRYDFF